jgi:hypothetical protein
LFEGVFQVPSQEGSLFEGVFQVPSQEGSLSEGVSKSPLEGGFRAVFWRAFPSLYRFDMRRKPLYKNWRLRKTLLKIYKYQVISNLSIFVQKIQNTENQTF